MSETAHLTEDAKIRRLITDIVEAYRDLYPCSAAHFQDMVEVESKGLHRANGMSHDGHFQINCLIPEQLHHFIKRKVFELFDGRIFFQNYKDYKLFTDVWGAAKVRKKTTPYLFLNQPN